jgi:hypothetical protein
LRQAVHVDRRALALFVAGQRLQQIDRAVDILPDGRPGRAVIQFFDLGYGIHAG